MKEKSLFKKLCIGIVTALLCLSAIGIVSVCAEMGNGEDMSIRLQSARFDPVISMPPEEPANLFISSYPLGIGSYIIQFDGPVTDEYKRQAKDLGVKFYGYVPNYAFIVRMDDATRQKVEALSFVRWVRIYQPAYRIAPSVHKTMEAENITTTIVNVLLFDVDEKVVTSEIQALGGEIIRISPNKIRVLIDSSKIADVAKIDGVMWIEKYVMPKLYNNVSAQIMNVDPIVWVTHGLDGTEQIVAVADTGIDTGVNDATMHDDFEGRITTIHSWPIQPGWTPYVENPGADDGASDLDSGHGTHTSGSVIGNGTKSNGDIKGIAYNARLVFQAIEQYVNWTPAYEYPDHWDGYYLAGIPDDLNDLFLQAYNDGARIHSNSWGAPVDGEYTSDSNEADTFIWDNKDMTILFAAGNEGNDSNRDGIVDYDSLSSPGTAKNVITVGASENVRLVGGYQGTWGAGWPSKYPINPISDDHVSDNSDGMAAFSSRGPCDDNRIKPDVVAPGTNVLSTRSSVAAGTGWGVYDQYYMYDGGTSMSTPLTAGASALVRQYYIEKRLHTPNASLIKATLINGAFDMPGQYTPDETGPTPNNNSGWGRVDLANSIFPTPPKILLFNDSEFSLSTGQNQSFYYKVTNSMVPLNITIVWTDYPAAVPAGGLVNDLDLIVTSPCGDVYHGNDFVAPFDDTFDRTNNVEQVRINSPEIGTYNVTVKAHNIPSGPQDFSLVIAGTVEQTEAPTEVEKAIEKGLCWLNETQNPDGSWTYSGRVTEENVGLTSMATLNFLNYGVNESDPIVRKAIDWILSKQKADGSITNGWYHIYDTSLATLALVATRNSSYYDEIQSAANFLVDAQNDEGEGLTSSNITYGGWGYAENSPDWSDLSNSQFVLLALHYAEQFDSDDTIIPADVWSKAEIFVRRCQNREASNPDYSFYDDGGFIYQPNSTIWAGGQSYASITTAGLWGLYTCGVSESDGRVQDAWGWIQNNYYVDQNYPLGSLFLYYYLYGLAKACILWDVKEINGHDWYDEMSDVLVNNQQADGHWPGTDPSEEPDNVATCWALLALISKQIPSGTGLSFEIDSPADLHVYDPEGRHVGIDYDTGAVEIEIPGATYSGPGTEPQVINISNPIAGTYTIRLVGRESGTYTYTVRGLIDTRVVSEESFTGSITPSEVHESTSTVSALAGAITVESTEPTPTAPPPVAAKVPTLTPIGIIALASLLAIVAVSRIGRKK